MMYHITAQSVEKGKSGGSSGESNGKQGAKMVR